MSDSTQNMINSIEKGRIYAIIPARAGSKGVKNKNIRCLQGYPLMAYSIVSATLCDEISRIIVSTDSEDYANIARLYGAETPFIRPSQFARDDSTDLEFMMHAIEWLYENENRLPEFFVHLRPTYPLRECSVISEAIRRIKDNFEATSLRSAHLASNTPYKWFNMTDEGYYMSIVENLPLDEANNPRQAFKDVYVPDGYVDVLRTSYILENNLLHGNKMIGYVVPSGVDIDALKDLDYLNYYIGRNTCEVLSVLNDNYKKLVDILK